MGADLVGGPMAADSRAEPTFGRRWWRMPMGMAPQGWRALDTCGVAGGELARGADGCTRSPDPAGDGLGCAGRAPPGRFRSLKRLVSGGDRHPGRADRRDRQGRPIESAGGDRGVRLAHRQPGGRRHRRRRGHRPPLDGGRTLERLHHPGWTPSVQRVGRPSAGRTPGPRHPRVLRRGAGGALDRPGCDGRQGSAGGGLVRRIQRGREGRCARSRPCAPGACRPFRRQSQRA